MLYIGSHVSMRGKEMFLGSVEETLANDANALMVYTGAPQNTKRKPIDEMNIPSAEELIEKNGIKQNNIVVHAPYIINLGNTIKEEMFEFAVTFLREEIKRAEALGAKNIVLHPGAHVGAGPEAAIAQIIKGLNEIIHEDQTVKISLETMSGKGTEIGRTFEELAAIIDGVELKDKVSVCLDTCHINDAGYDMNDFDGVMEEFDRVIGLDMLQVLHVNDSKNPRGSHKDRHANIGYGTIGFDNIMKVINHPRLESLPKILETPFVDGKPPYKQEISMIKNDKFVDWISE